MKIYSKYIFFNLVKVFLLSIFTLSGVILLVQLLGFISGYGQSGVGLYGVLKFIALQFSSILEYSAPVAVICSVLYTYNSMSSDSEITILESSGVSRWSLAQPGIVFSIFITIVAYTFSIFIDPIARQKIGILKNSLLGQAAFSSLLEEKTFNNFGKDLIVYVDSKSSDDKLNNIVIYDKRIHGKASMIFAESANIGKQRESLTFMLNNGSRHDTNASGMRTLYFQSLNFSIPINRLKIDRVRGKNESKMTFGELIKYKIEHPMLKDNITLEINSRLNFPLMNIMVGFVCLSCVLSATFCRRLQINKSVIAVIFSSAAIASTIILKSKSSNNAVMMLLLYINPWVFIFFSRYCLQKSSEERGIQIFKRML